jgi:hypothetical protein
MKNTRTIDSSSTIEAPRFFCGPLSRKSSIWLPTMLVLGEPETMVLV